METFALSILTIFAWGSWIAVAERVRVPGAQIRNLLVTLSILLVTTLLSLAEELEPKPEITLSGHLAAFGGGLIWTLGSLSGLSAIRHIGLTRAVGIWAPGIIVISIVWGYALFGENILFSRLGLLAIFLVLLGVILMVVKGSDEKKQNAHARGILMALVCALFWASYFIPMQILSLSAWSAALPMAVGMFVGAVVAAFADLLRTPLQHYPRGWDLLRIFLSGGLWVVGNTASLLLMERVGTGVGYSISQMALAVNAAIGIIVFQRPRPGSAAAWWCCAGVLFALGGAVLMGWLSLPVLPQK